MTSSKPRTKGESRGTGCQDGITKGGNHPSVYTYSLNERCDTWKGYPSTWSHRHFQVALGLTHVLLAPEQGLFVGYFIGPLEGGLCSTVNSFSFQRSSGINASIISDSDLIFKRFFKLFFQPHRRSRLLSRSNRCTYYTRFPRPMQHHFSDFFRPSE